VKQIESDLVADIRQVSPLHLNHATWHRITHLIVFAANYGGPSPTVKFGGSFTVIGRRNAQITTAPSTLVFAAAQRYYLWWLGLNVGRLRTSHTAVSHRSSCNRRSPLVIKYFIYHRNVGNVRNSALQLREFSWRTAFLIKYCCNNVCFLGGNSVCWSILSCTNILNIMQVRRRKHFLSLYE
jgi:hypothetical protein